MAVQVVVAVGAEAEVGRSGSVMVAEARDLVERAAVATGEELRVEEVCMAVG